MPIVCENDNQRNIIHDTLRNDHYIPERRVKHRKTNYIEFDSTNLSECKECDI